MQRLLKLVAHKFQLKVSMCNGGFTITVLAVLARSIKVFYFILICFTYSHRKKENNNNWHVDRETTTA